MATEFDLLIQLRSVVVAQCEYYMHLSTGFSLRIDLASNLKVIPATCPLSIWRGQIGCLRCKIRRTMESLVAACF